MDTVLTNAHTADSASGQAAGSDIYVIAAHPAWRESRVNRPLMEAARAVPRVQVQDLYSSYPDYAIDVAREQAALEQARLVVLLHPIQWYSMPALQKLWLDDVLTYGWAYGQGGRALEGKDLWLVATTGGPETSYHPQGYNRYFFDAFLPPYEQSAILCGMRFLPPMVLHAAHRVSTQAIDQHLATFSQRLQSYPDWPELEDLEQYPACAVPRTDRLPMEEASLEADPLESKGTGTTTNVATNVGEIR
ncbi:MAG: NAD(P)H-dependent oxidoreductase [Polaromonas sp.]|uniref:glutathione-regulated potassium-efflux system oxidoreductase KefF n=1 Tax=Polaromonas sp. TaxID=1869339 RepID=UPI002732F8FD|nr:NAD(P)H-dependent oxidoreductase [Polaromonas sp.]MDP3795754.1 NAD(P)H-dependent oxidoreductase [Polaromonas sp.]